LSNLVFPREIGLKRALVRHAHDYEHYVTKMGRLTSCYTSLYGFLQTNSEGRADYQSAILDRAWWDFDSGERGGIEQVKTDVAELLSRIGDADVRLVATGRGFHVHLLFKAPVFGRDKRQPLEAFQRRLARGLPTLDGVGFPEKLTRIPGTYNPKRGRWAVVVDHKAFSSDPHGYAIPKQPVSAYEHHDPYTGDGPRDNAYDFDSWLSGYKPVREDFGGPERVQLDESMMHAGDVPLMPCLARAIHDENPSHHVRVALVQHMADTLRDFAHPDSLSPEQKRVVEDTIFDYIKGLGWKNWDARVSRKGIRTNLRYARVPSCAWFNDRGMCAGVCWRYDGSCEVGEC
jgi:hypothetical protein